MVCPFGVTLQPTRQDCGTVLVVTVVPDTLGLSAAEEVVRELVGVLRSFNFESVGVEICQANLIQFNTLPKRGVRGIGLSFDDVYSKIPIVGTSVGAGAAHKEKGTSGTLGFFFKLEFLEPSDKAVLLAVTCHHVLAPDEEKALTKPGIDMVAPSDADHATWVQDLGGLAVHTSIAEDAVRNDTGPAASNTFSSGPSLFSTVNIPFQSGPSTVSTPLSTGGGASSFQDLLSNRAHDERRLQTANTFNRHLGHVLYTSGLTEKCPLRNCRLDWAVVDVTSASRFTETGYNGLSNHPPATLIHYLNIIGFKVAQANIQNTVFKLGRTSGPTIGVYHGCDAVTRNYRSLVEDVTSLECVVLPSVDEPFFARQGDSGALVYGPEGEGRGMIWGGMSTSVDDEAGVHSKPTTFAVDHAVFVTPLEALIRDVEAKCEREFGKGKVRLSFLW